MSSILKALKKAEEEKGARQGESADFARSLLRSEYRRPRSSRRRVLGGVVLLLALAVGAWSISRPSAPLVQPPITAAIPLDTASSLPADAPAPPVLDLPIAPARFLADAEVVEVVFSAPVIKAAVAPAAPDDGASPAEPAPPALPEAPQPQAVAVEPGESAVPVLSLRLSGIAWQEERASRLAIVDDLPVMEGTMIDGVMVEEILRDRVRFSQNGRIFELMVE